MSDYHENLKKVYITALVNFGNFRNFAEKCIFVVLAVDSPKSEQVESRN